jgi:glutathione synthase/RimK-type ligase-like ATP-grasp enzyme
VVTVWMLTDRRYLGQRMPAALIEWLDGEGFPPAIVVADDRARLCAVAPLDASLVPSVWERLEPGDLVVTRSRDTFALALLEEAEARGAHALDGAQAVHRVRHKATCALGLARRGLPIPPTLLASGPDDLGSLPESAFPLVVKPVLGDNAQGVQVLAERAELDAVQWDGQPLIAQAYVEAGGFDIKLYVAGDNVWATRRPGPLSDREDPVVRVEVTPELRHIADGCRLEFGLSLFGVDVLDCQGRLSIVDVNEFPNYTGVEEAPAAIGALVLAEAGASPVTTPERMSL